MSLWLMRLLFIVKIWSFLFIDVMCSEVIEKFKEGRDKCIDEEERDNW